MSVTSPPSRRHHTDPQPLAIWLGTPFSPGRRRSSQIFGSLVKSTPTLPSPSIVAARAYFLEHATPIGANTNAPQRRRSLIEEHQLSRRHSTVSSTGNLAVKLDKFTFSPGSKKLQTVPEAEETGPRIKVEKDEDNLRDGIESDDENEFQSKSELMCGTPQEILRLVPFQYTHDHLRDWGYAYLGKLATADAFVTAVGLRRPSLAMLQEDGPDLKSESTSLVTIRARVTPKAKERKPFLIQRQFDIEELRSTIPAPNSRGDSICDTPGKLRRSSRVRRQSTQPSASDIPRRRSLDIPTTQNLTLLSKGPVPIHIEYALHYLPALAALMLSSHVRKGDNIDLPVPQPTAWHEVITYIYTGSGILTSAAKENIRYLAGHA